MINEQILILLLNNQKLLPELTISNINKSIVRQLNADESRGIELLNNHFNTPEKINLVERDTIIFLFENIDQDNSEINQARIQLSRKLMKKDDLSINRIFIEKLVDIININTSNEIDDKTKMALDNLLLINPNFAPTALSDLLFLVFPQKFEQMGNIESKYEMIKPLLLFNSRLKEEHKKSIIDDYTNRLIVNSSHELLQIMLDYAISINLNLFDSETIIGSYTTRILNQNLPIHFLQYLVRHIPSNHEDKLLLLCKQMIESNNIEISNKAISVLTELFNDFSSSGSNYLCESLLEVALRTGYPRKFQLFETLGKMIKNCSVNLNKKYRGHIESLIISNDTQDRNLGIQQYSNISENIPQEENLLILRQIIRKLQGIDNLTQNEINLLDLIINKQALLERGDIHNFIDIFNGQILHTKNLDSQKIGLQYITRIERLYQRTHQVFQRLLTLAETTSDQTIKELCKTAYLEFSQYKKTNKIRNEAERIFGSEISN